jgi:hypothetical protein
MCPGSLYRFVPLPAVQHVSKIFLIIDMKAFSLFMFTLLNLLRNKLVIWYIKASKTKVHKTNCVIMCNNDKPYGQMSSGSCL